MDQTRGAGSWETTQSLIWKKKPWGVRERTQLGKPLGKNSTVVGFFARTGLGYFQNHSWVLSKGLTWVLPNASSPPRNGSFSSLFGRQTIFRTGSERCPVSLQMPLAQLSTLSFVPFIWVALPPPGRIRPPLPGSLSSEAGRHLQLGVPIHFRAPSGPSGETRLQAPVCVRARACVLSPGSLLRASCTHICDA